jgi:hypothetical protein
MFPKQLAPRGFLSIAPLDDSRTQEVLHLLEDAGLTPWDSTKGQSRVVGSEYSLVCTGAFPPVAIVLPTTLNFSDAVIGVSGSATWDPVNLWFQGIVNYAYPGCTDPLYQGTPCGANTVEIIYQLIPVLGGGFPQDCEFICHMLWGASNGCPGTGIPIDPGSNFSNNSGSTSTFTNPPAFLAVINLDNVSQPSSQALACTGVPGATVNPWNVTWSQ